MASAAKTIIATGASSGLGLEAIKQLISSSGARPAYHFIFGVRSPSATQSAYSAISIPLHDTLSIQPLELSDLKDVKTFAGQALKELGNKKLDYLFLNAALSKAANEPGPHGSKWTEAQVVNHLSQHYLIHLLKEKITESRTRIVIVSSGVIRMVSDTSSLSAKLLANSGASWMEVYSASKFTQLLGALYWKRVLAGHAEVVAVSPGMIPGTGLGRHLENTPDMPDMSKAPDAKPLDVGARSLLKALDISPVPEDEEKVFLTSWGEWWDPKEIFPLALDHNLQEEWCPGKDEIEKEARL